MLTFFWHGVSMLVAKEHPKHTLVVYAALTFFYDRGDGSLQVGQKVDADQNLDWDVGVWRVTVDLFILLVCVLIWIAWIAMALA